MINILRIGNLLIAYWHKSPYGWHIAWDEKVYDGLYEYAIYAGRLSISYIYNPFPDRGSR